MVTTGILHGVGLFVQVSMPDDQLRSQIGDGTALWADGERFDVTRNARRQGPARDATASGRRQRITGWPEWEPEEL